MKINKERLEKNLVELSHIGKNENGGIDRALSSEADREARKWLINYWENNMKQQVRIDAIANMWVRKEGSKNFPPLVIGSHHDAVPNGGMYDGALGVLAATEILQTLLENNAETRHPIEVVSFTGEEPNPFNVSTLGSKVLSGRLTKEDLSKLSSIEDGSSLKECIEKIGGNIEKSDDILLKPNDIRVFIELHIEQGKRLFEKKQSSATVSCITGIYREMICIDGDSNHGGTTNMSDRQDALLSACELNLAFESILKEINNPEVVGTIGYLTVTPNAVSIIPGKVELVLEIRCCIPEIKEKVTSQLTKVVAEIEAKRKVKISREINLNQPAMYMDSDVMDAISRGIESTNEPKTEYVSMAGHDASNMQRVTKSGMIFVQSINGKSHCPGEFSTIDDIEKTVNAMLEAIMILDKEMD
jgi:N-carbamoyl-L-amino-acid hydrolase